MPAPHSIAALARVQRELIRRGWRMQVHGPDLPPRAGRYEYWCLTRASLGMKGVIIV